MGDNRLEQVQQDLNTIKSAIPADFPYDRGSVALCLVAGVGGGLFALRGVPGCDGPILLGLLGVLVGLIIGAGVWLHHVRKARGTRPRRWNCGRQETITVGLALAGFGLYAAVQRWLTPTAEGWELSQWRSALAGPGLFGFGLAMLILSLVQTERRSFLGWGAAMTAVALLLPWLPSYTAFYVACGTAFLVGSLSSAAILWLQIRRWEAGNAGV